MSTYRCTNCQAVVQRAHICTRCGAPQATRHFRGLAIGIASAAAIAAFALATIVLQNAGLHHSGDHDQSIGDWSNYDEDDNGPPMERLNEPSIFTTLGNSDAGIW